MAKELNPLHIDVKQIITLYRECGFSATTLNPYPAKMANFMEAFWSDKEDFLLSIKKEDKREEHVESKLQAMIVFDLVQRMFIPTLLVKYVSYTAMEAYYNFMASLITMGAINWSTLHAVTTVRYRAGDGIAENTMMGRWCDLYNGNICLGCCIVRRTSIQEMRWTTWSLVTMPMRELESSLRKIRILLKNQT